MSYSRTMDFVLFSLQAIDKNSTVCTTCITRMAATASWIHSSLLLGRPDPSCCCRYTVPGMCMRPLYRFATFSEEGMINKYFLYCMRTYIARYKCCENNIALEAVSGQYQGIVGSTTVRSVVMHSIAFVFCMYLCLYVSCVGTRLLHLHLLFLVRYTLLWNRVATGSRCLVTKEIEFPTRPNMCLT